MSEMSSLAQERQRKEQEEKAAKIRAREETRKWLVPMTALIAANLIFLSLDIRAIQAVYLLTQSWMLAGVTVLISGGLAMYWFDVLYPHSKRHKNDNQKSLSIAGTVLAVLLSAGLAFADYIVGTGGTFSKTWSNILWGAVIILTVAQGVMIAVWWSIDKHIEAEARIEEAYAEASDQNDEMAILRTRLSGLRGVLTEIKKLNTDFGSEEVKTVAGILGIVLPDTKAQATQQNRPQAPQQAPMRSFAADTPNPLDEFNSAVLEGRDVKIKHVNPQPGQERKD